MYKCIYLGTNHTTCGCFHTSWGHGAERKQGAEIANWPSDCHAAELLHEIVRVKDLMRYYDSIPNGGGRLGASILNELVSEAYNSLVNYDIVLINKYYDLLQNCD